MDVDMVAVQTEKPAWWFDALGKRTQLLGPSRLPELLRRKPAARQRGAVAGIIRNDEHSRDGIAAAGEGFAVLNWLRKGSSVFVILSEAKNLSSV